MESQTFTPPPVPNNTPPNNYLVWSILTTLFCCLPFGIVSIIKAAEVNTKFAAGDYQGAMASSAQAKKWAIVGAIVGGVAYLLVALFYGAIIIAAISSSHNY